MASILVQGNVIALDFNTKKNGNLSGRGSKARSLTAEEKEYSALLIKKFKNHLFGSCAYTKGTVQLALGAVNGFLEFVGIPFWECKTSDLDEYLAYKKSTKNIGDGRMATIVTYLRRYQDMLANYDGLIEEIRSKFGKTFRKLIDNENIYAIQSSNGQTQKTIEILTEEEINLIIRQFDIEIESARLLGTKNYNTLRRNKVIFLLFLLTGIRISELKKTKISSFEPDRNYPNFGSYSLLHVIGKGNKPRTVRLFNPMIKNLMEWYIDYVRPSFLSINTKDQNCLFYSEQRNEISISSIQKMLNQIAKNAGITRDIYPHLLRHTYATQMKDFIGAENLQRQLGHAHLTTTLSTYFHPDPIKMGNDFKAGIENYIQQLEAKI